MAEKLTKQIAVVILNTLENNDNALYSSKVNLIESILAENFQPKQDTKLNETNNSKTGYWPPEPVRGLQSGKYTLPEHWKEPVKSEKPKKIEKVQTTGIYLLDEELDKFRKAINYLLDQV